MGPRQVVSLARDGRKTGQIEFNCRWSAAACG